MSAINTGRLPYQKPDKITLSPKKRAEKRKELFEKQRGICACGCGKRMTQDHGSFSSATLEHSEPEPMGCAKNDADENLECWRWDCNVKKGSKRL